MTPRILVCDDEPHITRAIALKLQRCGFEVQSAADGLVAWERLNEQPPALVITDYQMPKMNGLELVERMRANERLSRLPVVLLTAKGFELTEEAQRIAALEIEHIVLKPFSPRELAALVTSLLSTSQAAV